MHLRFFFIFFMFCSLQHSHAQQSYFSKIARLRTEILPTKVELVSLLSRSRLNTFSNFEYPTLIFQYALPFHISVGKVLDTNINNEFISRLITIRPVLFYYKSLLNSDFGVGLGIRFNNKITSKLYWSYQIGAGWFEGNEKLGIKKSINFLHFLSVSYLLSNRITGSLNVSHISNGGLFGLGSNQDLVGIGLAYNFF